MGIIETVKSWVAGDKAGTELDPKRQSAFILNVIRTGELWPEKEWDKARTQYEGETDEAKHSRSNLWRSRVNTQEAFLNENIGRVRVSAMEGFEDDPEVVGEAACNEVLFAYLAAELGYHKVYRQWDHSVSMTGLGFVLLYPDRRRVLPSVRFLQNEQVRVDGNCGGDIRRASWLAYCEELAPETVFQQYPGSDLEKLKKAAETPPDIADDASYNARQVREARQAQNKTGAQQSKCRVWFFFARNEMALYDSEPKPPATAGEEGQPHFERFLDKNGMTEPRRYIVVVENYEGEILKDENKWPDILALDWDEWPVVRLAYQEAFERVSGFTDWRHEEKIIGYHEDGLKSLHTKMLLSDGSKIGARGNDPRAAADQKKSIETDGIAIIPNAIDEQGQPRLTPLSFSRVEAADLDWLQVTKDEHDQVSNIPKVMQGVQTDDETGQKATAREVTIATDAATSKLKVRLRLLEEAQTQVAKQILAMAHVMIQKGSSVEMPAGMMGDATMVDQEYLGRPLAWTEAQDLIRSGGTLVLLGIDAMVGPELAGFWKENEPLDIVRRNVKVQVEEGSTQGRLQTEKVSMFLATWDKFGMPLVQATGRLDIMAQAMKKVLTLQGLTDFESLVPEPAPVPLLGPAGPGPPGAPAEVMPGAGPVPTGP